MGGLVTISCVKNPFDPYVSREIRRFEPGHSLAEYFQEMEPGLHPDFEVAVSVNGQLFEGDRAAYFPGGGEFAVFCAVPRGGGGDGKNPMATVAMLAVLVLAGWAGGAAAGALIGTTPQAMGTFAYSAVQVGVAAGITVAGGVLVNAVLPPSALTSDLGSAAASSLSNSPTYSWSTQANPTGEGAAVPIVYGRKRVTPLRLNRYVETFGYMGRYQRLHLKYLLAGHKIYSADDVYIDGQPLKNYDQAYAYTRRGTLNQSPLPGFGDTLTDKAVGVKLTTSYVTRTTGETQGLKVVLTGPNGLYHVNDRGGLDDVSVQVYVEYRPAGGSWVRFKEWTKATRYKESYYWSAGYWEAGDSGSNEWVEVEEGSTEEDDHEVGDEYLPSSPNAYYDPLAVDHMYSWRWLPGGRVKYYVDVKVDYITITAATQKAIREIVERKGLARGYYEIRVKLKEAPPAGTRYKTDVYWEYYQEAIRDDFRHPGTALLAIRALATNQLSGAEPVVDVMVDRGPMIIPTPSGPAEVLSSSPAWACYDLITNDYYGGGKGSLSAEEYNKFYSWAEWCALNGHTVNICIDAAGSLQSRLDMISPLGRGRVTQIGNRYTCIVDRPAESVDGFMFTMGNIRKGGFKQKFLSHKDRASAVEVTWFDPEKYWDDKGRSTTVVHAKGYDEYDCETNPAEVVLYGCDNLSQATRHGRYLMNSTRYITQTVSFPVAVDALGVIPGELVDVAHDVPQWGWSGRIVSAAGSTVVLDREVTLEAGVQYALRVQHAANDVNETVYVQKVAVDTETDILTVLEPWDATPAQYEVYTFGRVGRLCKQFRASQIDWSQDFMADLAAVEYVPEALVDNLDITVENVSSLTAVYGLTARESWIAGTDGAGKSVIDLSWKGAAFVWHVSYRPVDAGRPARAWTYLGETASPDYRIETPLTLGRTYQVGVGASKGAAGAEKAYVTILGKMAPPNDVTGFTAVQKGDQVYFRWDHILDSDRWGYEIRQGLTWETGQPVVESVQENSAWWSPPLDATYKFWIKAIDRSGIHSVNAVSYQINVDLVNEINVILTADEIPTGAPDASSEYLVWLSTSEKIAWIPGMTDTDFDAGTVDTDIADYAGDSGAGAYTSQVYDLGEAAVVTLRIGAEIETTARNVTDQTYPNRTDQTFPMDTDVSITSLSTYTLEYRLSVDDVEWTDWTFYKDPVKTTFRYWQVRATTAVDAADTYFAFTRLDASLDVPDKELVLDNQAIGSSGTTFTLASLGLQIFNDYSVGVTVLGATAATPTVEQTSTQFTVHLFNSGGAGTAGNVKLSIRGF